jgi:hypothetical protein
MVVGNDDAETPRVCGRWHLRKNLNQVLVDKR